MNVRPLLPLMLLIAAAAASGQALPTASTSAAPASLSGGPSVGFALPTLGGSLRYALTASENITSGFFNNSGVSEYTNLGGNLGYISKSERHPFSALYSGGYLLSTSNQSNTFYQSLSFSQVLSTKKWNIVVADSVSYLPQGPTLGLSGVAGVGDLGVASAQAGSTNGLGILTTYGPRVNNNASITVSRTLTGKLSAQATGGYSVLRFVGDNSQLGLNSTSYTGSTGLSYRLNGRSTLSTTYSYSRFSFVASPVTFSTQTASVGYTRQLRADLSFAAYGGPQFSNSTLTGGNISTISAAGGASLAYLSRPTTYALAYNRGVGGGYGVVAGALTDSLSLTAGRTFSRVWNASAQASYSHSKSLPAFGLLPFTSNSVAVGGQISRGFTRTLSGFASYNVVDQQTNGVYTRNAFSGLYQVVGFGVTYAPSALNLARR